MSHGTTNSTESVSSASVSANITIPSNNVNCESTQKHGCANAGNSLKPSSSTMLTALLMFLFAGFASADRVESQSPYIADDQDHALDLAWQNYLNGDHRTTDIYYDTESDIFIQNVVFPEDGSLSKRWDANNAPLGTWFHQSNVTDQGLWEDSWKPASGCDYNGNNDQVWKDQIPYAQESVLNVTKGFDFKAGEIAAKEHLNVTVSKYFSEKGNASAHIPAGSVAQVWASQHMVWQDQQRRSCVRRYYGKDGVHCNKWDKTVHGDLLDSFHGFKLEVREGHDNVRCD